MKKILTLFLTVAFSATLLAQTNTSFYGRNGSYQGQKRTTTSGNTTTTYFYDARGALVASSRAVDNGSFITTSYYDAKGAYQGQTTTRK